MILRCDICKKRGLVGNILVMNDELYYCHDCYEKRKVRTSDFEKTTGTKWSEIVEEERKLWKKS